MTNCPPIYRNLQCESFGNKRKVTSQMLRQLCKNDAYLYEQIMALWDATDPQSKKRFYPPFFMDVAKSFGVESYVLKDETDLEFFKYFSSVYRMSEVTKYAYEFDFNGTYDRIGDVYPDPPEICVDIGADSLLDLENHHNEPMLEIVNGMLRPPLTENSYKETIHHNDTYKTVKVQTSSATKGKYVTVKDEKVGSAKKDAHFYGAFKNWDCNNHWYNGYNRNKNYNVKSAWKKDPYNDDDKLVKKYGRIPSVCHAQTFKALNSGYVSKVNLNIQGSKSAVSPCTVEIRETNSKGTPTTKVLARTEKKFGGSGENIVAFEFKTKAKVEKGETYAIVVRSPLSKFENTFRWGGWTTGCFSSESKYYSDGSAYTSQDNGKTWTKNGKTSDTKSYGAHYYDWGINQKPIDFAFEVWVQPITQKSKKKWVKGKNATYKNVKVLDKSAYDEVHTYTYNYYKEGSYYLHLKPIHVSPIRNVTITDAFSDSSADSTYWCWEFYDSKISKWVELNGGGQETGSHILGLSHNNVNFNNNEFNPSVLMLRVRCDIEESTFGETLSAEGVSEIDKKEIQHLKTLEKLKDTPLTFLRHTEIEIYCRKPTDAYLRTEYYHPPQDQMLGASVWSEVDVNVNIMNDVEVNVDIIHEREAVEHIKFYDLSLIYDLNISNTATILSQKALEMFETLSAHIYEYSNGVTDYTTGLDIISFIKRDKEYNDSKFLQYLWDRVTPIYILPYKFQDLPAPTYFFDRVKLAHLPSYPLVGGDIGDDDIIVDTEKLQNISVYGACYPLEYDVTKVLNSINLTYDLDVATDYDTITMSYTTGNYSELSENITDEEYVLDEEGYEVEESQVQENVRNKLTGVILKDKVLADVLDDNQVVKNLVFDDGTGVNDINIDYAITSDGKTLVFNFCSKIMKLLFQSPTTSTTLPNNIEGTTLNNLQIKMDLTTRAYQEFVDFEVDYDTGELEFYNQHNILTGDFRVSYNPLWVRGLSVADFPLTMDLWIERYKVSKTVDDNGRVTNGIYKQRFNTNTGDYENGVFYPTTNINPMSNIISGEYFQFKTTVPPLDSIRKLVVNENDSDGGTTLIEDSQFFVDYNSNTITIYDSLNNYNDGDIITVHYTPNLTDNGLAIAYRLKRPRRNANMAIMDDDNLSYDPSSIDNAYIGMQSFTYRT